ncbi:hypothetical protein B296_00050843 [Ensete ventricosum]|uniref:GDSL esterase/lipase n=1 Tax=Ensete ventricosum TaxID=4639 RepID=A0A426YJK8_ENSVE|nr:hypothetical protein B296_00050843 [Ensete ventricosum]
MGGAAGRPPRTGLLLLTLLLLLPALPIETAHEPRLGRRPVIFNFGDSNSDTGGLTAGLGLLLPQQEGRGFFHHPSGRLCDGRLVIDFLCDKENESNRCALAGETLNSSYLSPYMESLGADFRNGANFAVIGSCTRPPSVPFSLAVQVQQFLRFKLRSLELVAQGFETALMTCCGYGGPPYNFNQRMGCGSFGSQVCPLGSKYISWDGVHYTEAANAIVASKILTTKYSKPNLAFDYFCTA